MREKINAYYTLIKPGIIRGNVLHVLVGIFVAMPALPSDIPAIIGVIVGTIGIIASACVINNYTDRNLDRKMSRTKSRPSVTGIIPSTNAAIFSVVLLAAGFVSLALFTNVFVVAMGALAFVSYIWWYAVAKRASVHGTLVGALPGALPISAGYTAVTGTVDIVAILLFVLVFIWQIPHFYAISIFRRSEYAKANLPVPGVVWPFEKVRYGIIVGIILYVAVLISLYVASAMTIFSTAILTLVSLLWLYVGLKKVHDGQDRWAKRVFGTSLLVTLSLLTVTLFDYCIGWQLYATLIPS